MKTFELRRVTAPVEIRKAKADAPPMIAGYCAVYGSETVIAGMFRERIEPGAFRKALGGAPDVRGTFDHELVLGRTTNGSLRLSADERGLRYEIDPNLHDTAAMDVVARVERGDVTGSSFGFRVAEGGDRWQRAASASELPLRIISEFELLRDVGPVSFPAYDDTTAEARSAAAALLALHLRDDSVPEKNKTASGKEGKYYAGTDGTSYPITDPIDVHNAAHALGRDTKGPADRAKVKANIIRIAYELGPKYVAQLPNDWKHAADQRSAEEQAELITYNALKSTLEDIAGHLASANGIVDSLIANETHDPSDAQADEDAEEQIEQAQLGALAVIARQLAGAAAGLQQLTGSCMDGHSYGYYSASTLATARAAIDVLELEV